MNTVTETLNKSARLYPKNKSKDSKITLPVTGMTCAACAVSVESMLKSQAGVKDAGVNFANQTAWVDFNSAQKSSRKRR
jgi:Cu2+-exporting ATPase